MGRGCYESAKIPKANPRYFRSAINSDNEVSLDRLGIADVATLCEWHDASARRRSQKERRKRTFYGWHCFEAHLVRGAGGQVVPSPKPGNPWHADIIPGVEARDDLVEVCNAIAAEAQWVPRPDVTTA